MPDLSEFLAYKVVVATNVMAGKLYNYQVPAGHFDIVCIDEAGHATIPEVVGSVIHNLSPKGQVILAGDPKQLGPVIFNAVASELGLGRSLLERLMEDNPVYKKHSATMTYDSRVITKLVNCYRCHHQIIRIPNEKFYDNELRPSSSPAIANALIGWEHLPNKSFPLIFHGVEGENMREGTSPSWFNPVEVDVILNYVNLLIKTGKAGIEDIMVITPYKGQVKKVRSALTSQGYLCGATDDGIAVGSCEQMQGQERKVVIISTVRSSPEHVESDATTLMGFISSPKRFNVSVTRAQALLVIVGSPSILSQDSNWNAMMKFCVDNGGYIGAPRPAVVEEEDA